MARLATIQLV